MQNNNIHNEIARFLYNKILEKVSHNKFNKKEFRSLARSFPSMVQVNGLGASIAFLFSKNRSETHKFMYQIIDEWTKQKFSSKDCKDELINRITNMDSAAYRIYTNEVMTLSLWVKRFTEGLIKIDG